MTDDVTLPDAPTPDAPEATPVPDAAPPTAEQQQETAVAKFREAVEAVSEKPAETEPEPVAAAPDQEPPAPDAQPPMDADPVAAQKAAVDAEIAKFNADLKAAGRKPLTEKAEARFRELVARPKLEDVEATIAPLRQQAERMAQMDAIVEAAQAKPEQIQRVFGYLQAINSGDPALQNQALDAMLAEVAHWSKLLGREGPGVDPLEAHADLKDAVESGQLERKFALQVARDRANLQRQGEYNQQLTHDRQLQQEVERASADVDVLNDQLKANDPQFLAKLQFLIPTLRVIKSTMRPSQWVAAIKDAYLAIPAIPQAAPPVVAAAPAKPHVGAVPIRPTGANGTMRAKVPQDPVAAFKFGLDNMRS